MGKIPRCIERILKKRLTVENLADAVETYYRYAYEKNTPRVTSRNSAEIAQNLLEAMHACNDFGTAEDRLGAEGNGDAKIKIIPARWLIFGKGYELDYNRNCFYYNNPRLIDRYQAKQREIENSVREAWRREGFPVRTPRRP